MKNNLIKFLEQRNIQLKARLRDIGYCITHPDKKRKPVYTFEDYTITGYAIEETQSAIDAIKKWRKENKSKTSVLIASKGELNTTIIERA